MLKRLALLLSAAAGLAGLTRLRPVDAGPEGELPAARHERRDIRFRTMLAAGVAMLLALLAIIALPALLFPDSKQDQVVSPPQAQFPVPQLQPNPVADMAAFRKRQLEQLNSAYWIDRDARRVHLPIAQAMRDVAQRGIPDWPTK
ncbi:MAG: hypothetical protein JOZ05_04710 [Acetobacteraceae bacterium]|nr:hypothetical protein [Acetobacteraceae bacterium]